MKDGRDGFIPDYGVLEKLDKEELIKLIYRLERVITSSIELNSNYSDMLWDYEHIYDLKEEIRIRDKSVEHGEEYLFEIIREIKKKYMEEPDDRTEEN